MLALTVLLCTLLAIFVSAETYNVKYADIGGGGSTVTVKTNEDGKITLRETPISSNAEKVFYGWFADDGTFYTPAQEITVTKNITLREAYAFEVYTFDEFKTRISTAWALVKLMADIDTSGHDVWEGGGGAQSYVDLNGHTLSSSGTDKLLSSTRRGFNFLNSAATEGKIVANKLNSSGAVIAISSHGYSSGQHLAFSIGKNVTVETTGSLFRVNNSYDVGGGQYCPYIRIWGTVIADSIVNQNKQWTNMAELRIYSGADVTLTGKTWWKNLYTGTFTKPFVDLAIEDGAKVVTNNAEFSWLPSANYVVWGEYAITGGSYSVKFPDGILKNGYEAVYNAETGLYNVQFVACTTEGSNGAHTFKVQEAYQGLTASCLTPGLHYYRCACGSAYIDDVAALGHSYTSISIEKVATTTENGIKRVTCENCADSYTYEYSFDPRDQIVTIVVKTEDTTKEITATVGDIYDIVVSETTSGFASKFNGVKTITDPDNSEATYNISKIVKLVIPAGVTEISAGSIKNATELTEIVLLDGANATFITKSIDNCTKLSKITLGECTVVFNSTTINGNVTSLAIDASKANVTFKDSAFDGKAVSALILGKDKFYSFGSNCFRQATLERLVFPDGSNPIANGGTSLVTFPGAAAFYACPNLKYVYFGANIIAPDSKGDIWITNKPFDCAYSLETVVLMDVTNINEYVFCCAAAGNENKANKEMSVNGITVYHHGSRLSLNQNTFANRKYYGVKLYTTANITALSNCIYTIYNGIPHAYAEGNVDATCTAMGSTGYTTDCPCGEVTNATYTVYSTIDTTINSTNGSIEIGQTTPALGHEFDEADGATIVGTTPATCLKDASVTYKCARCDETLAVVQEDTATGHNVEGVEWEIKTQATCVADGLKQKTCKDCKALAESEVIPAFGHQASGEWVTTQEASCTVGATRVQYCKNEGCTFVALSETTEPNGHVPSNNWIIEVNPSCTKAGSKYQRCTTCNAVCETATIDALGHEFDVSDGAVLFGMEYPNGFNKAGAILTKCARCDETSGAEVAPIFEAKGYSTNPDKNAINGGYSVNTELLALYESYNGAITYGVVIANANSFTGSFFNNGAVNTEKAIQVPITMKSYSNFDLTLSGFGANAETLELVICAYVIDEDGNATFIQAENDYAVAIEIGEQSFTKVTLALVVANAIEQPDATTPPSNDEEN